MPRAIAKFAIPTILSQLVTILYSLADTFFVGHTNDPDQMAALTLSFPIFMMITCICNLMGIGSSSLISRSLGRKDPERAKRASVFGFYGAILLWAIWAILLVLRMRPILFSIGASENTVDYAASYLRWTVLAGGLPAVCGLMMGHLIRAEGRTKQASIGLSLGGVINIILDPIFVSLLGMGVEGAAVATAISTLVTLCYFAVIVRKIRGDTVISVSLRLIRYCADVVKEVILVGIPAAAVILLGCASNAVQTHLMSPYGDVNVAAYGIVQKVTIIAVQLTVGITHGIMPLISYSYAAGNRTRTREICRDSFFIIGAFAVISFGVCELFSREIISAFIDESETVACGSEFLRRIMCCAAGMCFVNLFNSIFQAIGKWLPSTLLSAFRQGLLLIPLLIIMNGSIGLYGLVWAQPVSDTIALIAGVVLYVVIMKKSET